MARAETTRPATAGSCRSRAPARMAVGRDERPSTAPRARAANGTTRTRPTDVPTRPMPKGTSQAMNPGPVWSLVVQDQPSSEIPRSSGTARHGDTDRADRSRRVSNGRATPAWPPNRPTTTARATSTAMTSACRGGGNHRSDEYHPNDPTWTVRSSCRHASQAPRPTMLPAVPTRPVSTALTSWVRRGLRPSRRSAASLWLRAVADKRVQVARNITTGATNVRSTSRDTVRAARGSSTATASASPQPSMSLGIQIRLASATPT